MTGGTIISLLANERNIPDLYLTGDPQITYFKILFRRFTPFSMQDSIINIQGNMRFGDEGYAKIRSFADMLHTLSIIVDVPIPDVEFKDPTYRTVRDILIPCGLEKIIDQIALANGDKLDDPVDYETLFGPDITNPTGPLAEAMESLVEDTDVIYSKRLEVLDKFKTDYTASDNRFGGKYVAIKPELIDFTQFQGTDDDPQGPSVKPIDPAGYLVMKADRTQDMYQRYINNPANTFIFNCSDFMYDGRTREQYLAGETVELTGLEAPAIPVMEDLIRAYPRQIPNFRPIRTITDYTTYLAEPLNHVLIFPISQIDLCRRVLLESRRNDAKDDPEDTVKLDALNLAELDECIFGDISILDLIAYNFEFGVYSYDPNFDPDDFTVVPRGIRSAPDFNTCLANLFRQAKIRIPIVAVDRDFTITVTEKFNRYCVNENAIYNKTYDLREPLRVPLTAEDMNGNTYLTDTEGYWLLDVSLIDRLEQSNPDIDVGNGNFEDLAFNQQDVIMLTPDVTDQDILINPFYLDARSDRLDWATYIIDRNWTEQIYKREIVDSTNGSIVPDDQVNMNNPDQVPIFTKPENIRDGVDILSDMVLEMYGIQDVEQASDIAQILNNDLFNVEDIEAYHAFLEAYRRDMLNTENQVSSYRLNSASGCDGSNIFKEFDPDASQKQTLFNARDIQEIMTGKLLRDIIYVDQQRQSKNFADQLNFYFRKLPVFMDQPLFNSASWIQNNAYNFGTPPDLGDREITHNLIKYILWSYHLEYVDVQTRATFSDSAVPLRVDVVPTTPYDFYESEVRYFNLYYPMNMERRYYVWFDTNGDGTTNDPGPPVVGAISLPVDISGLTDPNNTGDVAQALSAALNANADFGTTVSGNVVTITSAADGNSTDIADNNTGFALAVMSQGTNFSPEISTVNTSTNVVLPANYYTSTVRLFDLYFFNPVRYYVWMDTDGDGTTNDPGPPSAGAISLPVNISNLKLPNDRAIAQAIRDAIDALDEFEATICQNTITIRPTDPSMSPPTPITGAVTDISDFNTMYRFDTTTQGDTGVVEVWEIDVTRLTRNLITDPADFLSKMLIQVPVEFPVDPIPRPVPVIEHLKNVHYGKDDVINCEVYEDDSIIERFRTDIGLEPDKNYFDRNQLLSGVRFNADDSINDQIEDLRDLSGNGLQNPLFVDGRGTAINREVELYHVIRTINHNSSENLSRLIDSTIRQYFEDVIAEAYRRSRAEERNYINTISYAAVIKYLNEFFSNTFALDSELSVEQIGDVLLDIAQNTVVRTMLNYNQYLFYIWRNSSYVDEELDPRIYTDTYMPPVMPGNFMRLEVDFCQPGNKEFLEECYPNRIAEDPTLNPLLLRAKYLAGIDKRFRPRMGYGFTFDLVFKEPDTYRTEKSTVLEEREFTADSAGDTSAIGTPSVLGASNFKDQYSEYIDNQVNRVKNQMKDVINFGPSKQTEIVLEDTLRENMVYADWFDLQVFQRFAVDKIREDLMLCTADLSYYPEAYVINHLPMTLTYYYGLYAQKIYASIYLEIEDQSLELIESSDEYKQIPSTAAETEDATITPLTDATVVATGDPVDSVLQFMSTDIRENAQCPIHGPISNLTDNQRELFDTFLRNNAVIGDTGNPIYAECPLCFRTYAMNQLFDEMRASVFSSDSKIQEYDPYNLRNDITDDEYIQLIINGTADQVGRDGRYKTIFLFRPEIVHYDRVTETYFDTAMQYMLVRFATIQYRYARMVLHIAGLSLADYGTFLTGITPTPATIFGQSNALTFTQYSAHLTNIRTGMNAAQFEQEYDLYNKAILHEPTDDLLNILKNQVRAMDSTTEFVDYGRGAETIFEYNPDLVIQNINFDPTQTIVQSYESTRHLMYRGNIAVWYTIQRRIIDLYNEYMNNLIDPREIESTNDLFIETYNIIVDRVPDQFKFTSTAGRTIIDFYRLKQVREAGQVFELPPNLSGGSPISIGRNDLEGEAVDMITYARELAIYYHMLIVRYEKAEFALELIKNATLDDNTFYFEKTDTIVRQYLDPIRERIQNLQKLELVLDDVKDRECFYFNDTSNLYYVDALTFRISADREGNPEFVEDFRQFYYLNNYHLSQSFTYNQIRNLYRLLGFGEVDEIIGTATLSPSIRVAEELRNLNLVYTDNFKQYRSLFETAFDASLNNTTQYTMQILTNAGATNYEHLSMRLNATNRGLFYDMWSNYPTVSTILYDLDFDPVVYNDPDPNLIPGTFRYLTGIKTSSPLNILKNRLEQFEFNPMGSPPPCGVFHTPELRKWEAKYICSKNDTFDALRRVFNVYYFLTGACDYQDIYSMITFARLEIAIGNKALTTRYKEFEAIADDIVRSLGRAFSITNDQLRIQQQLTTLMLLDNRHDPSVEAIKSKHIVAFKCIEDRIDLVAAQFDFYMRGLSEMEITELFDDIYDQIEEINETFANIIIDTILDGLAAGITNGTISTIEELEDAVNGNLDNLEMTIQSVIAELDAKLLIIQEQACLKFTFIRSSESSLITDARVHTPQRLFNLKELQLMNNFQHVEDVIRFLIAGVVAFMTPTTDRITPIYLDGIVTDAEKVIIDAETAKIEENSQYDRPSIFDGGFNPLLAEIIGDSNPFRAGNYFSTSLCEAMKTLFSQIEEINSETQSYQNMVDDLIRSIQGNLEIMKKLTVLERYVDLTKAPVCGFFFYDFDRFIPFTEVRELSSAKDKKYSEHKADVRGYLTKKKRQNNSALIEKGTKSIYQQKEETGLVDARTPYKKKRFVDTSKTDRQMAAMQNEMNQMDNLMNTPLFVGSEVYERILKILRITDAKPQHAWVRQLGIRMIEDLALIIDGEEIDGYNDELMLLLRKTMVDPEHDRGMDIMIGHIPEMYEISDKPRAALRLYIPTWFAFSRFPGCSLPLVNMLYSNVFLKLKLRKIEELLYIEPGAELKKPVKIDVNFMGRYIYLEDDERRRVATTKIQTIMERYRRVSNIKAIADVTSSNVADGGKRVPMSFTTSSATGNVTGSSARVERLIQQRYYFEDPTKFLMWRMRLIYPNPRPEDIIYWDIAAGSPDENKRLGLTDERGKLLEKLKIFDRVKIRMNNVTRENFRQEEYHRRLVPYNRNIRALDLNEGVYSFALFLKGLGPQPNGATNLTMIDNMTFYYDMSEDLVRALESGARLQISMFQCSHNTFLTASGFGALGFYGTHYS